MSAVSLRADGDSTPGSDGGERITRLFPKCRPRAAMAANTHDRIIEIAGGRELYSQSRTKAMRKLRHSTNAHKHNLRNKSRTVKDGSEYNSTDNYNGETIVQRIVNNDTLSRTMISKQTSPSIEDRKMSHIEKNCILPRDTPPPLEMTNSVDSQTQKGSPIAVVADGEVVVFDDISEDWKGLRLDLDTSDNELDVGIKRTIENVKNGCNSTGKGPGAEGNYEGSSGSTPSQEEERASDGSAGGAWASGDDERNRVTRVIGELPIAEYEGSPRRYGIGQVPHSRSPRPGFPQRVITDSGDNSPQHSSAAFDYLYEFSETRKVLEEFFRCPTTGQVTSTVPDDLANFQDLEYELRRQKQDCGSERGCNTSQECSGRGGEQRRARPPQTRIVEQDSPRALHNHTNFLGLQESDAYEPEVNLVELSVGTDSSGSGSQGRTGNTNGGEPGAASQNLHFTLSPETTDCDSNCGDLDSEVSLMLMENDLAECNRMPGSMPVLEDGLSSGHASDTDNNNALNGLLTSHNATTDQVVENGTSHDVHLLTNADLHSLDPLASCDVTPPPPAPAPHRVEEATEGAAAGEITAALQDLRTALRAARAEPAPPPRTPTPPPQVWVPSKYATENTSTCRKRPTSAESTESVDRKPTSGDEDEADTDLETDRLLGQQRTDDQGFFDDKGWRKPKSRTVMPSGASSSSGQSGRVQPVPSPAAVVPTSLSSDVPLSPASPDDTKLSVKEKDGKKKGKNKEGIHVWDPSQRPSAAVLIEGVLFRARYLGSTQLVCEGQPTKATRMLQAEEAVSRIKAPEGENQPSTEVDLFISTEKIMVLNTELKEIMMDHALRTISYIADIGDLVVLMARRRFVPHETDSDPPKLNRTPKMICHVFESEEAQFIAQSIGQAFQVAYMEFLKANGIEDHSFVKEMDYQEVLNSQEIFGDELQMFAKKELQKEVVVPKTKGEILGVVVVESGWGSMLPTVVIANLAPAGAAARCGQLNIGDQIIAINGVSLVGLPLSTCQTYIKNSKNQTVVKLTVVPCPPVVEVKIKRPDTKYQLGFSVQNGVICSLLRGGIAERGGVRVGHRIIEINSQSVVAVPHERIVNLLATSVGEILMKTMPTSMFRLLTGQENPIYI